MRMILLALVAALPGCASPGDRVPDLTERNRRVVMEAFEVVGAGEYGSFDRYIAPDYVRHCQATPGVTVTSLEEFKAFIRADREVVPDQTLEVRHVVAEGDLVAFYATYTGTQTGPMGDLPPTGRRVSLDFAGVHRLEDGRIAETWVTWDNMAFLSQLGLAPDAP